MEVSVARKKSSISIRAIYSMAMLNNKRVDQMKNKYTGWWYTYPSKKYEFVNGKEKNLHIMENIKNLPKHQAV